MDATITLRIVSPFDETNVKDISWVTAKTMLGSGGEIPGIDPAQRFDIGILPGYQNTFTILPSGSKLSYASHSGAICSNTIDGGTLTVQSDKLSTVVTVLCSGFSDNQK